jgi:hypothetical protein
MAETQEATDGYNGEFWLHDGTSLYELRQVKSFDIPDPGDRTQEDVTHLKSAGRRREYISTWFEDSDFTVVTNSRPGSTTDTVQYNARKVGDIRPFLAVLPEDGVPTTQVAGTCKVITYTRGTVEDGVMEATSTCRVVSVDDIADYEAPAP